MPTYQSPGVYVEEVSSGSRPIEGVGTAVCAFVGFAERGTPVTPGFEYQSGTNPHFLTCAEIRAINHVANV